MKRILAILLSVLMVFTMLPTNVYAEELGEEYETIPLPVEAYSCEATRTVGTFDVTYHTVITIPEENQMEYLTATYSLYLAEKGGDNLLPSSKTYENWNRNYATEPSIVRDINLSGLKPGTEYACVINVEVRPNESNEVLYSAELVNDTFKTRPDNPVIDMSPKGDPQYLQTGYGTSGTPYGVFTFQYDTTVVELQKCQLRDCVLYLSENEDMSEAVAYTQSNSHEKQTVWLYPNGDVLAVYIYGLKTNQTYYARVELKGTLLNSYYKDPVQINAQANLGQIYLKAYDMPDTGYNAYGVLLNDIGIEYAGNFAFVKANAGLLKDSPFDAIKIDISLYSTGKTPVTYHLSFTERYEDASQWGKICQAICLTKDVYQIVADVTACDYGETVSLVGYTRIEEEPSLNNSLNDVLASTVTATTQGENILATVVTDFTAITSYDALTKDVLNFEADFWTKEKSKTSYTAVSASSLEKVSSSYKDGKLTQVYKISGITAAGKYDLKAKVSQKDNSTILYTGGDIFTEVIITGEPFTLEVVGFESSSDSSFQTYDQLIFEFSAESYDFSEYNCYQKSQVVFYGGTENNPATWKAYTSSSVQQKSYREVEDNVIYQYAVNIEGLQKDVTYYGYLEVMAYGYTKEKPYGDPIVMSYGRVALEPFMLKSVKFGKEYNEQGVKLEITKFDIVNGEAFITADFGLKEDSNISQVDWRVYQFTTEEIPEGIPEGTNYTSGCWPEYGQNGSGTYVSNFQLKDNTKSVKIVAHGYDKTTGCYADTAVVAEYVITDEMKQTVEYEYIVNAYPYADKVTFEAMVDCSAHPYIAYLKTQSASASAQLWYGITEECERGYKYGEMKLNDAGLFTYSVTVSASNSSYGYIKPNVDNYWKIQLSVQLSGNLLQYNSAVQTVRTGTTNSITFSGVVDQVDLADLDIFAYTDTKRTLGKLNIRLDKDGKKYKEFVITKEEVQAALTAGEKVTIAAVSNNPDYKFIIYGAITGRVEYEIKSVNDISGCRFEVVEAVYEITVDDTFTTYIDNGIDIEMLVGEEAVGSWDTERKAYVLRGSDLTDVSKETPLVIKFVLTSDEIPYFFEDADGHYVRTLTLTYEDANAFNSYTAHLRTMKVTFVANYVIETNSVTQVIACDNSKIRTVATINGKEIGSYTTTNFLELNALVLAKEVCDVISEDTPLVITRTVVTDAPGMRFFRFENGTTTLVTEYTDFDELKDSPQGAQLHEITPVNVMVNSSLYDNGLIGLNYYILLEETVAANEILINDIELLQFGKTEAVNGVTYEVVEMNGTTYYKVSYEKAASRMTEECPLVITENMEDGAELVAYSYSVASYGKQVLADKANSDHFDAVKALLNYGAAAQVYFDVNTEELATKDVDMTSVSTKFDTYVENLRSREKTVRLLEENDAVTFIGASLICASTISLKYYFRTDEGIVKKKVESIKADGLDKVYSVEAEGMTVKYSPADYMQTALKTNNEKLINLSKALWCYSCEWKSGVAK